MITPGNYHENTKHMQFSLLPEALQKGHEFVKKVTNNGASWDNYHSSEPIKKTIDTYFVKLHEYLEKNSPSHAVTKSKIRSVKTKVAQENRNVSRKGKESPGRLTTNVNVERISEEVRFIKRFVKLHGKTKTKDEILRFLNSLQKAILERKIRKTSLFAKEVLFVQERLIHTFNSMGTNIKIELKPETIDQLSRIAGGEKVLSSVGFIKRYIALNGKLGMKEKAKSLLKQINLAYESSKIVDSDPYIVEMHDLKKNLEQFIGNASVKVLKIEPNLLTGLSGILGCACQHLNGLGDVTQTPEVMNSVEFSQLQFDTLGFTGKWLEFIGDPSRNFTVMVFGKPKMGKSTLCLDFAGYLARNHGNVLYVAKEEGLDKTLQDKLQDTNVMHDRLDVASTLPDDLSAYQFIFLDSVNKLGLKPDDLNRLKALYPAKAFIYVFQTTKDGNFRGANSFQHDVDSVIEVPERGKAIQFGRFNQGGEMSIFYS